MQERGLIKNKNKAHNDFYEYLHKFKKISGVS